MAKNSAERKQAGCTLNGDRIEVIKTATGNFRIEVNGVSKYSFGKEKNWRNEYKNFVGCTATNQTY